MFQHTINCNWPRLGLALAIGLQAHFATAAQPERAHDLEPGEVYASVVQLGEELELLRLELGARKCDAPLMRIENATPRDAYAQAWSLLQKANRLSHERLREAPLEQEHLERAIDLHDVLSLIQLAQQQIRLVTKSLGVEEACTLPECDPQRNSTDVTNALLNSNRQVNLLLERRFCPADVYSQITVAIHHASRIVAHDPDAVRRPPDPPFEHHRRPRDVFLRLLECHEHCRRIAKHQGLSLAAIQFSPEQLELVEPGDVYNLAAQVRGDVVYLDLRLNGRTEHVSAFYPGPKIPADCFQRAGVLVMQLEQLENYLSRTSD